ncbi:hypothetical protein [Mesorhizobium sp.]|uniref:hypothetical protein n=1 Tax=Mesorhizobium sp. TaxID=1871066 RepID=UPI0025DF004D|nr:hypothetical protein [Mesorhizobium sp.]
MVFSLALFMPPEVLALNVNDVAAVRAFNLGVSTNPTDERLRLMMATGTFHVDFEAVRLALCHLHASTFVSSGLSLFFLLHGQWFLLRSFPGKLGFFLGRLGLVSLTPLVSIVRLHRHSNSPYLVDPSG